MSIAGFFARARARSNALQSMTLGMSRSLVHPLLLTSRQSCVRAGALVRNGSPVPRLPPTFLRRPHCGPNEERAHDSEGRSQNRRERRSASTENALPLTS